MDLNIEITLLFYISEENFIAGGVGKIILYKSSRKKFGTFNSIPFHTIDIGIDQNAYPTSYDIIYSYINNNAECKIGLTLSNGFLILINENGTLLKELKIYDNMALSFKWSMDLPLFITGSEDGYLKLWSNKYSLVSIIENAETPLKFVGFFNAQYIYFVKQNFLCLYDLSVSSTFSKLKIFESVIVFCDIKFLNLHQLYLILCVSQKKIHKVLSYKSAINSKLELIYIQDVSTNQIYSLSYEIKWTPNFFTTSFFEENHMTFFGLHQPIELINLLYRMYCDQSIHTYKSYSLTSLNDSEVNKYNFAKDFSTGNAFNFIWSPLCNTFLLEIGGNISKGFIKNKVMEYKKIKFTLLTPKQFSINIYDKNETELADAQLYDVQDDIFKCSLDFDHLILITSYHLYIYKLPNFAIPLVAELGSTYSTKFIMQSINSFLILRGPDLAEINDYDGNLKCRISLHSLFNANDKYINKIAPHQQVQPCDVAMTANDYIIVRHQLERNNFVVYSYENKEKKYFTLSNVWLDDYINSLNECSSKDDSNACTNVNPITVTRSRGGLCKTTITYQELPQGDALIKNSVGPSTNSLNKSHEQNSTGSTASLFKIWPHPLSNSTISGIPSQSNPDLIKSKKVLGKEKQKRPSVNQEASTNTVLTLAPETHLLMAITIFSNKMLLTKSQQPCGLGILCLTKIPLKSGNADGCCVLTPVPILVQPSPNEATNSVDIRKQGPTMAPCYSFSWEQGSSGLSPALAFSVSTTPCGTTKSALYFAYALPDLLYAEPQLFPQSLTTVDPTYREFLGDGACEIRSFVDNYVMVESFTLQKHLRIPIANSSLHKLAQCLSTTGRRRKGTWIKGDDNEAVAMNLCYTEIPDLDPFEGEYSKASNSLWALYLGHGLGRRNLEMMKLAYSALKRLDKLIYLKRLEEAKDVSITGCGLNLIAKDFDSALKWLLQYPQVQQNLTPGFRGVWLALSTFRWEKALKLAQQHPEWLPLVIGLRSKYLEALSTEESNPLFKHQLRLMTEEETSNAFDWTAIQELIQTQLDKDLKLCLLI